MMIPTDEYVLLETLDIADDVSMNDFLMPCGLYSNGRLGKYKVLAAGNIAKREYGIEDGMIIYADRLACKMWRSKNPLIKYNSIIYKQSKDDPTSIECFKNMVVVKDEDFTAKNDNVFKLENTNKLNMGKIVYTESPNYKVDEHIVMTGGPDVIKTFDDKNLFIYKDSMIIGKVIV